MDWLARISVKRPVFAAVLMLLVTVLGLSGYVKLGVDEFPNVDIPVVLVMVRLPGAAPPEIETDVVDKLEGSLSTIAGVDELRSSSAEGIAQVIVSFNLEKNADVGVQEVRDKISQVMPDLPKGIDPPVVSKIDPSASPVMLLAVRSRRPIREITELTDKVVRRRIESISGVGQVTLVGGRKREIRVWLDPVKLRARNISVGEVQAALALQNLTTPGGRLEAGPDAVTVRVEGRVSSPAAMGRIVVRNAPGAPVRVDDVGRVEDGEEDAKSWAQLDDERTVVLIVRKQAGENTVAVVDAVKARLDEVQKLLPDDAKLDLVRDNSATIRTGTHAVTEHLVLGALFASLVVLLFLGDVRSTFISAISIPISVIGTFAVMRFAGFTLNSMTLLALALAVGIVIDDAIVVLENIIRWVQEKGKKPFVAAVFATKEIGLAVLATTLSLMAVFIPVAFMGGIVGRFLGSFGLTMAFAIGLSMLVSFTLTPTLSARMLRPATTAEHGHGGLLSRVVDWFYRPIERVYGVLLAWVMKRRWVVVLACVGTMGACVPIAKRVPGSFLPAEDRAQFEISARASEGTTLDETRLVAERIAAEVRRLPGVTHTLMTVGEDAQETANLAKVVVLLTPPETRDVTQFALMDRVRKEIFPKYRGLRVNVAEVNAFSTGQSTANVQYALTGRDLSELSAKAERILSKLRKSTNAVDVDTSLVVGKPEARILVDRDRAAELGVRVADIANTLQLYVAGLKATSYAEGGEQYDVRVRADAAFRADVRSLGIVDVPSSRLGNVSLDNVVRVARGEGPSVIDRINRQRTVTLLANAAAGVGDSAVQKEIQAAVAEEGLPAGGSLLPLGRTKEQGRAAAGFLFVFVLSFVFVYLVLAAQFESWVHPITILVTLPLTVPFALLSLLVFHQTLNIFSGLGLLVLFGVVKKNAILQVDQTNQLRERGMPRLEAILEANRERLRPILMTTLAFVAGMVPLMTGRGIGVEKNRAIAGLVLGGQSLSLLLTLLAAPVVYSLLDDLGTWVRRLKKPDGLDRGEAELKALLGDTTTERTAE